MTLEVDANREVRSGMKTRRRCRDDKSLTLELVALYLINIEKLKQMHLNSVTAFGKLVDDLRAVFTGSSV